MIRTNSRRPSIWRTFISKKECTASTAISSRMRTATESSTPSRARRFEYRAGKLFQRSMVDPEKEWEVVQTLDTITPGNEHYNQKSAWAKTIQTDGKSWGNVPADAAKLAHANSRMTCYACHTSWTPNCFGCHLSMMANQRKPMLHN